MSPTTKGGNIYTIFTILVVGGDVAEMMQRNQNDARNGTNVTQARQPVRLRRCPRGWVPEKFLKLGYPVAKCILELPDDVF